MPRQTKEDKIRELEETNKRLLECIDQLSKRNQELVEAEEGTFVHSPTYLQMQSERDFFKNLSNLNERLLAEQKKKTLVLDDKVKQIYEDNRQLTSKNADMEYFVGIVENRHDAKEYMELREKIFGLEARVDQQAEAIANRDAEIVRLQKQLAEAAVKEKSPESDQPKTDKTTEPEESNARGNVPRQKKRRR
ncbi:MAG: hypothetical protein HDQ95_14025 [Roseburia sp.]|nr:hypothetical protein [Roseburia sp.]